MAAATAPKENARIARAFFYPAAVTTAAPFKRSGGAEKQPARQVERDEIAGHHEQQPDHRER